MGCSVSTRSEEDIEENLIKSAVSTIVFDFESKIFISKILGFVGKKQKISQENLADLAKKLDLPKKTLKFLKKAVGLGQFNQQKILSLLVLLGRQDVFEKAGILFKLYADDYKLKILKSEGEILISHLIQIHLQVIPMFTCSEHETTNFSEKLNLYYEKLSIFNNSLFSYFSNKIFGKNTELNIFDYFSYILSSNRIQMLFNGKKLRKFCLESLKTSRTLIEVQSQSIRYEIRNPDLQRDSNLQLSSLESNAEKNHQRLSLN